MTNPPPTAATPSAQRGRNAERSGYAPFGRTVAVLSGTAVLATGQLYGMIPLLDRAAAGWNVAPASLTWLVSVFGFGYAAGFLLFGPLSDRFGRRRVIIAGVAATALSTGLVAVAPSAGAALALRFMQGLTIGAFPPVAMAYVAERVEPRHRLVAVTSITTGFLAAAVLGQLAAQGLAAAFGWRSFFLAGAAAFAAAALLLGRTLLPDGPPAGGSPLDAYRAMPPLLAAPGLRLLFLAVPAVLGSFVAIFTGLQLTGTTGLLELRTAGLPVILAIPFLTPLLGRVPGPARVAAALGAAALGAAALGTALIGLLEPGTLGLALLLMLVTAGTCVAAPGLIDTISSRAGDARASAVSLFSALLFAGASLGPQLAGALAGRGLPAIAHVLAAVLAGAALLTAVSRRHPAREQA